MVAGRQLFDLCVSVTMRIMMIVRNPLIQSNEQMLLIKHPIHRRYVLIPLFKADVQLIQSEKNRFTQTMPLYTNASARFITLSLCIAVIVGYFRYWNPFYMILAYTVSNTFIHILTQKYCAPFISGKKPKHLVLVVTGWLGHYLPFKPLQQRFREYSQSHPETDGIMVHLIQSNSNGLFLFPCYKTNEGIAIGAERMYNELRSILDKYPSIDKISFIGCSLGGLYSRYCLALLFADNSKYAHIEAMDFITMASPHCGVDDWLKTQFIKFFGVKRSLYELSEQLISYGIYSPTLRELALLDEKHLLIDTAQNDAFLKPLESFRVRVCFGNGKYDKLVSCDSALLLHGAKNKQIGSDVYDQMMNQKKEVLVKEIEENIEYDDVTVGRFEKLQNMKWQKVVVCWDNVKYGSIIHKQTAIVADPLFDSVIKFFKF